MQKISDALVRNGIRDVYGFGNSWSLVQHRWNHLRET
jgi:hypothetical protein